MISSKLTVQALMRNDLTGQAYEHGLTRIKKKVCFAFGEKGHIASRHLFISGRDLYGYNLRFRFDVNPEPLNLEPLNGYNLPNQPFNQ